MTDPTPDPHDDLLRDALRAEAEGVHADADLLGRIQGAVSTRPAGRRVAPWLLVAAACALVAGVGATLLNDDDGQQVESIDDPSSSTTSTTDGGDMFDVLATAFRCEGGSGFQTVIYLASSATAEEVEAVGTALDGVPLVQSVRSITQAEVTAALEAAAPGRAWDPTSIPSGFLATFLTGEDDLVARGVVSDLPGVRATHSTDCAEAPDLGRPTLVALVREDGWLVTIDLTTGEERELHSVGDPNASTDVEEGGPYFIDDVELSPDNEWVYFSTCCEPASGNTYRIPVGGGEPELFAVGAAPRVSPDGRFVATGGGTMLLVTPTDRTSGGVASVEVACCTRSLAWSPDGAQLALVDAIAPPGEEPEVLLFDWDGAALTPKDMGKPSNPGLFVSWTPDGTLNTSHGTPIADDRTLSQDGSYGWLLWIDEEGVVREQVGNESGDRTPIPGLPEALAADW